MSKKKLKHKKKMVFGMCIRKSDRVKTEDEGKYATVAAVTPYKINGVDALMLSLNPTQPGDSIRPNMVVHRKLRYSIIRD